MHASFSSLFPGPGADRLPRATMSRARQPPLVTGISPKEGAAWTKVTIRGENLGTGPPDLIGNTFMTAHSTVLVKCIISFL